MKQVYFYETKLGKLGIAEENSRITDIVFSNFLENGQIEETPLIKRAYSQITEYLSGKRKAFDLPLAPKGTEFQETVWRALMDIPYGETRSYAEIAGAVGNPKACRAVGGANNKNPIAIVIPCHRVVGANGEMVGYGAGIGIKRQLLTLESPSGKYTK